MKIIVSIIILFICGYVVTHCEQSLFKTYSKKYDEEHDLILARKVANEVIRILDERENNQEEIK